ncbi:unnamed protein product [Effrenium voratum]|nr:unnamed protein product [Effrenium voratum]
MDGAFCMVLGLLGVSPQHFMLGHTLASWRFSLEYACFGAMLTNGWGEQAELLVILRLVLALISAPRLAGTFEELKRRERLHSSAGGLATSQM